MMGQGTVLRPTRPGTMKSKARHPEGLPSGCFGDQALDRCLFFDYNDIKYGADRLLLNQQILGQRTVPCPTVVLGQAEAFLRIQDEMLINWQSL